MGENFKNHETLDGLIAEEYERNKYLEEDYGAYQFVVPKTSREIMQEGITLMNALQVPYFSFHVSTGEMQLVFLKRNGESYADIAIKGNTVFHAVCKCNSKITEEDYHLIRRWVSDKNLEMVKTSSEELQDENEDTVVQYDLM